MALGEQSLDNKKGPEDFGDGTEAVVARWNAEHDLYDKQACEFYEIYDEAWNDYLGRKNGKVEKYNTPYQSERFQIFWASMQVLRPSVYARIPKVVASKRFEGRNPVARLAAKITERTGNFLCQEFDFNKNAKRIRDDYLIGGRGVGRVAYEKEEEDEIVERPIISIVVNNEIQYIDQVSGEIIEEANVELSQKPPFIGKPVRKIKTGNKVKTYECVKLEYQEQRKYRHTPGAKTWREVTWVSFEEYLTKAQMKERFKNININDIEFDRHPGNYDKLSERQQEAMAPYARAVVREIYDYEEEKTIWICPSYRKGPLDEDKNLYGLKTFFPCPEPVCATLGPDSLFPYAFWVQVRDAANQLHFLADRISTLVESLRLRILYDSEFPEIAKIITGKENDAIPVADTQALAQSGGLDTLILWFPIDKIAAALQQAYAAFNQQKMVFQEQLGIADILRGASDPRETAKAQQIKGRYATLRISEYQEEFQVYLRDCITIMLDMMLEQFDETTIQAMSGFESLNPEEQQLFPQALQLLKNDKFRTYQVDIETDSTIAVDEEQKLYYMTQLSEAVSGILDKVTAVAQGAPDFLPVITKVSELLLGSYREGDAVEGDLQKVFDSINAKAQRALEAEARAQEEAANNPQPDPPTPEQIEAESKAQERQVKTEAVIAKTKTDIETKMAKTQADIEKTQAQTSQHQTQAQQNIGELNLKQFETKHKAMIEELRLETEKRLSSLEGLLKQQATTGKLNLEAREASAQIAKTRQEIANDATDRTIEALTNGKDSKQKVLWLLG